MSQKADQHDFLFIQLFKEKSFCCVLANAVLVQGFIRGAGPGIYMYFLVDREMRLICVRMSIVSACMRQEIFQLSAPTSSSWSEHFNLYISLFIFHIL